MKYYTVLRNRLKDISRYRIGVYAANTSFYIILSVFPTIMLLAALIPAFGVGEEALLDAMKGVVPQVLYPLIEKVLEDMDGNSSGILLSTTAPVAIWSASGGVYCIRQGLNAICDSGDNGSFLLIRLSSMVYTVLLILALVLTLVVNGFGRSLVSYMTTQEIPIIKLLGHILRMRGFILMVILTLLFGGVYCIFPNKKQRFRSALPGSALAALGWLVFTEGYSLYVRFSGSYSLLYGSLSIIAMGMVWLYVCISILFYGYVMTIYVDKNSRAA